MERVQVTRGRRSAALRSRLTLACNAGAPRSATCSISGPGLSSAGEPLMYLH
jgi:hypothetical protein